MVTIFSMLGIIVGLSLMLLVSGLTSESFANNGSTITEVESLEHDASNGENNSLVQVDSDTYALAYSGSGSDGYISTFTISSDGTTITEVASIEHDTTFA